MAGVKFIMTTEEQLQEIVQNAVANALAQVKSLQTPIESNTTADHAEFLTKKQAAKLLACSPSTIDNFRRSGKLTPVYLGKTVRFKRSEILALATKKGEF